MTTPPAARLPNWLMVVGMALLAVIGLSFITLGAISLARPNSAPASATPPPTLAFTSALPIPTTTPAPPTNTPEPSATASEPPTEAPPTEPAATAIEARAHIVQPANVREGPGQNYLVLCGLNSGDTP